MMMTTQQLSAKTAQSARKISNITEGKWSLGRTELVALHQLLLVLLLTVQLIQTRDPKERHLKGAPSL